MTRRRFIKGLLGFVLAGLFAALYGFVIEPALRLRVKRWRIDRDDWTKPPLKIVVLADLHAGEPVVSLRRIRQIVRRANAIGGDVIVLLGDYAASHRFVTGKVAFSDVAARLSELSAPQGVHAILGNHDWWDDPDAQARGGGPNTFAQSLEAAGIAVLSNSVVKLEDVWLAGLEDQLAIRRGNRWVGLDDLPGTLAQIIDDDPVVLLAHEPDIFPNVPSRVALTLSGHTHGGQLRLFGWSPVVPSRYGNRFAYGHVREEGRDLVVSGGLGCSILPLRFGVVPEIAVIEIGAPRRSA